MKKTKQLVVLILTLGLLLSAAGLTGTAAGINIKTASPTQSAVTVNGSPVNFQAYNIDGANYFKLRDVAQAIKNTGKQFDVGYDSVKNAITVTTGKTYTAVGGELAASGETGRQTATLSTAKVILDGKSVQLTAFLIGGYNYFKLRDIGSALNFGVTWGAVANTISINTTIPYNTGAADIGFYDPGVDYNSKPRYKIVYMMADSGSLYDMFDQSFKMWADRMNCDYSSFSAGGDPGVMLETIEIYAAQGVDGFLLDPYTDSFTRINEILVEHKIPWIPCMTLPTDSNGQLLGPAVGFDNKAFGVQMANWTIDYAKKAWPNAKVSQIGMLSMDFSLSPQIHERTIGAQSTWNQHYPQANFFIADGKDTSDLSADAGYALTASVFDAHPNIKYWLICTFSDDYAQGASAAAVQYGKQNSCVVIDCGGSALINQWDSGKTTCWKASIYVPQMMFAEPMICGLYAMIDGQATAETLWPSWTDKKAGDKYAYLKMPSFVLTKDNYKEYLEWVDTYTGFDLSHYPYHGTQFSARATPPTY